IDTKSIEELANIFTNVEIIKIYDTSIKPEAQITLTHKCEKVIDFTYHPPGNATVCIGAISQNWPHLKKLDLDFELNSGLKHAAKLRELTHLNLTGTNTYSLISKVLTSFSNNCSTALEYMNFSFFGRIITDKILLDFANRCKNLKEVNLASCSNLTSASV